MSNQFCFFVLNLNLFDISTDFTGFYPSIQQNTWLGFLNRRKLAQVSLQNGLKFLASRHLNNYFKLIPSQ